MKNSGGCSHFLIYPKIKKKNIVNSAHETQIIYARCFNVLLVNAARSLAYLYLKGGQLQKRKKKKTKKPTENYYPALQFTLAPQRFVESFGSFWFVCGPRLPVSLSVSRRGNMRTDRQIFASSSGGQAKERECRFRWRWTRT